MAGLFGRPLRRGEMSEKELPSCLRTDILRVLASQSWWRVGRPRKVFIVSLLVHYLVASVIVCAMCVYHRDPLAETVLRTTLGCPMVFIGWILIICNGCDPYWHIVFPMIPVGVITAGLIYANRIALWALNIIITPLNICFAIAVGNFARNWTWG